jgi:chromosomal replication initiator protein
MTDIWQAALRDLETKVSSHNYESWFKNIQFHHQEGRVAHLEVEDAFFKAWIEENYIDLIEESLTSVAADQMRVVISVVGEYAERERTLDVAISEPLAAREARIPAAHDPQTDIFNQIGFSPLPAAQAHMQAPMAPAAATPAPTPAPQAAAPTPAPAPQRTPQHRAPTSYSSQPGAHRHAPLAPQSQTIDGAPGYLRPAPSYEEAVRHAGLNPRYTFDEFVVGPSNQFTHAACISIANNPGTNYNPLFIFGGVGLGKTHLLQAIGLEVLRQDPRKRVVTLSSEGFMNKLITSLRQNDMNSFRTQFRDNCDVLLIDDIQFIGGKDSTQEEFFHTFNALHHAGKQIVMTSDKSPKELPGIEERLRSRFSWGLIADVQPPEIETRLAILEKKAEADGITLDKEVGMLLASSIRSNVRDLEGTLVRLSAQASLMNQPITVEMARQHLRRMNLEQDRTISVDKIITRVAEHHGITASDIRGSRRTRTISEPRQFAMYLARKLTDHSYPELGRMFGGKDHTTVLAACRKLEKLVENDQDIASSMRELELAVGR